MDLKKSLPKRTNLFSWHSYFSTELSSKAWKKMKDLGITSQSQFVIMAVKKFIDTDGK